LRISHSLFVSSSRSPHENPDCPPKPHIQNNQRAPAANAANAQPPAAPNDDDDLEQQVRDNVAFLPPRHNFPKIGELLCPRFNPCSFIFFACVVELAAFVATLAVGAAKFDGAFVVGNAMGGPSTETFLYMGGKWCVLVAVSHGPLCLTAFCSRHPANPARSIVLMCCHCLSLSYTSNTHRLPFIQAGQVWRLVTAVALHAGIMHIASNMFFQCRMGFSMEEQWGAPRMAFIYIISGVGGNLLSCMASPVRTFLSSVHDFFFFTSSDTFPSISPLFRRAQSTVGVGASGALFGILGGEIAWLLLNWHMMNPVGRNQEMCRCETCLRSRESRRHCALFFHVDHVSMRPFLIHCAPQLPPVSSLSSSSTCYSAASIR
jgi:membrane associated rhomboid family serine protease